MNKSESKYFNTAKKMNKALLSLLEQKDFDFITVRNMRKGRSKPFNILSSLRQYCRFA